MAAEQRKLLEQLMGENLMVAPGTSRGPSITITDPKACKSYICGTCPHDLFTNTKQDLGPCPKVHNEALKEEYETADDSQKRKWGFDFDYLRDMQRYIDDCNRRIDQAQRRLEKTPDEIRQTNALVRFTTSSLHAAVLTLLSLNKSMNCRAVLRTLYSRFRCWVSWAASTQPSPNTSKSDN